MKKTIILILFFCIKSQILFSQMTLNRDTSIKVKENNIYFNSAFAGGLNSVQFSDIDLNLDGIMDIIIFDKSGNKISPFINNNGNYTYAPIYRNYFPELHDWILLADYNCDGKNDIFTYSSGGIAIYKNTSTNSLSFNLITPLVLSDYGSSNINIYVSGVDIPAISDIDYDGDLDILTFSILGGFVEYHKNMSMELKGNCDTIAYKLETECWGAFYEGLNNYNLNCTNCQCPIMLTGKKNEKQIGSHAGSTLLAIDIDNDNDKDLILGDISYTNLNLLINGGNSDSAHIISVDSIFPQNNNNTIGAEMHVYPASFYIDVTNDGIKDLIVTTNTENNSENHQSCWLYENLNQNSLPDFNFIKENFIQGDMVDLGKGAYPAFYDYNNDGLEDLVVGNYGYHVANNNPISSLALFENTGTINTPEYELSDRDWLNLSSINLNTTLNIPALNISPTFGDIDGDGDKDLLIGDADGKIHLFQNIGNGSFQITSPNYQNIDVGYFATPQLIDVNRDGLIDIIIGEQNGTINFCPNSGTQSVAIFDTIINDFGNIDVDQGVISSGYSSPKMIDSNGVYQLFVGSYTGKIYQFTNIDNNLNGSFVSVNSTVKNIWDGGNSTLAIKDITNDGFPDMIVGNSSGGIAYFSSDSILTKTWNCTANACVDPGDGTGIYTSLNICQNICINSSTDELINKITVFPNPTNELITITGDLNISKKYNITISDLFGRVFYHDIINQKTKYNQIINLKNKSKGIYILKIEDENYNSYFQKIIFQ